MTRRIRLLAPFLPALVAVSCSKNTDVSAAPDTCGSNPPRILSVAVTQRGTPTSRADLGVPVTVTVASEDPDVACSDTVASYAWSFISAPTGSTSGLPSGARGPAITFTPDLAGSFQFRAVAVDAHGNASEPVVVTVPTGPCGPTLAGISATPAFPIVGTAVALSSLPASPTSACVAGGALSFLWSLVSRPAGSGAALSVPAAASPSLVPDVPGSYLVELVVTDAGGFSTVAQQAIAAAPCTIVPTVGPVAVAATDPQGGTVTGGVVHRDDLVALSASVTPGACGLAPVLSFDWTMLSRPAGSAAVLGGADTATPYFIADVAAASWELMLVVRDAFGNASAPAFVRVTTSDCGARPPLVATVAAPATPNAFAATLVTATVADAASLAPACPARFANASGAWTLAWSVALAPAGAHPLLVPVTGTATATFESDLPGSYAVRVTATGPDGVTGVGIAPVAVGACGSQAPLLSAVSWVQPTPGGVIASPATAAIGFPATFLVTATDADLLCGIPQPLAYAWRILSQPVGSAATLAGATTSDPSLTPDVAGTWTIEVTVTDPQGHSSVGQQTLTAT